jgi:transposase-like protein
MFRAVNSTKADQWRSRLRRFQSSGMSVMRFCEAEGVSAPSFYQWRKRLKTDERKQDPPTFLPVRLTQAAAIEIHLPNGARVCLPAGQAEVLRVAIDAAGRLRGGADREADAC